MSWFWPCQAVVIITALLSSAAQPPPPAPAGGGGQGGGGPQTTTPQAAQGGGRAGGRRGAGPRRRTSHGGARQPPGRAQEARPTGRDRTGARPNQTKPEFCWVGLVPAQTTQQNGGAVLFGWVSRARRTAHVKGEFGRAATCREPMRVGRA